VSISNAERTVLRRERKAALAKLRPGADICAHAEVCGGLPMWPTPRAAVLAGAPPWLGRLDLDDYPGRVFGGPQVRRLSHAHCNRSAGAAMGNRMRRIGVRRNRPVTRSRDPVNDARRARW
jgi:hypothetical protein